MSTPKLEEIADRFALRWGFHVGGTFVETLVPYLREAVEAAVAQEREMTTSEQARAGAIGGQATSENPLAVVELKGVRVTVPIEDWRAVGRLAPLLFGLTLSGASEKACAAWALRRAADLIPALRREAISAVPDLGVDEAKPGA